MKKDSENKRCVVLLIDGISSGKLSEFFQKGLLPNIKKLSQNGTYIKKCISTFPSVTGPAHVPIFMGKPPFYFGIVGHNQFYRNFRYFDEYLIKYEALNRQLQNEKSVFDYYKNSIAIGELVHKGVTKFVRYISNLWVWLLKWDIDTDRVLRRMLKEYEKGRDLIVGWIPNTDSLQHICRKDRKFIKAMKKIDKFVGKLIKIKDKNTRIIICSDHGMEKVKKRRHLKRIFRKMGLLVEKMRFNFDGGGFAQIYFKHPKRNTFLKRKISYKRFRDYITDKSNFEEMMAKIAKTKTIEFLIVARKTHTYIFSGNGIAKILKKGAKYLYTIVHEEDPFQYSKDEIAKQLIDRWVSKNECLAFSRHTEYPDAIYQTHGLLQLRNAGELIITSAKGITWNYLEPYAVHGGLRAEQMVTPLIISERIKNPKKEIRTTEIFDYIVN